MDLSGFRETISTRGKILPARSRMVGSVNGKSIIVPRIRVLGQGRSLAHPTIKQDQPSAADMLDGIHKPQPFFDKLLVSRETGQVLLRKSTSPVSALIRLRLMICATSQGNSCGVTEPESVAQSANDPKPDTTQCRPSIG